MCVVSMVMDYGRHNWPWNPQPDTNPYNPFGGSITSWTLTQPIEEADALKAFEELVAAAEKLDRILGLADCEDPEKAKWLDGVRERVRAHEVAKVNERLKKK